MNNLMIFLLKGCRKIYKNIFGKPKRELKCKDNPDKAAEIIFKLLSGDKPCMVARFGSTELMTVVNYLGVKNQRKNVFGYIRGTSPAWWWEKNALEQMQRCAGFFPPTEEKIKQFCQLMINDSKQVDVLGSWLSNERYLQQDLTQSVSVSLIFLDPYWSSKPWTRALQNKKVLVVHPFAETIRQQYKKKEVLFENPDILPPFELHTLKAVQSIGGESNGFKDWFDALHYMESEMDKIDYDICLIGCGAYGFPLAAHAKRQGKKAVHLGGSLQLLFGIKGKRWLNKEYALQELGGKGYYSRLLDNPHWVFPRQEDRPPRAGQVEDGCYWGPK